MHDGVFVALRQSLVGTPIGTPQRALAENPMTTGQQYSHLSRLLALYSTVVYRDHIYSCESCFRLCVLSRNGPQLFGSVLLHVHRICSFARSLYNIFSMKQVAGYPLLTGLDMSNAKRPFSQPRWWWTSTTFNMKKNYKWLIEFSANCASHC